MWPREEDFTHDQYRPMALVQARAGLDSRGNVTGWTYRNVSPSILAQRGGRCWAARRQPGLSRAPPIAAVRFRHPPHRVGEPPVADPGRLLALGRRLDQHLRGRAHDRRARRWPRARIPTTSAAHLLSPIRAGWRCSTQRPRRWPDWGRRGAGRTGARHRHRHGVQQRRRRGRGDLERPPPSSLRVTPGVVRDRLLPPVNPDSIDAQMRAASSTASMPRSTASRPSSTARRRRANFNQSRMIRLNEMPEVACSIMPPPAALDRAAASAEPASSACRRSRRRSPTPTSSSPGTRVRTLPFFPARDMGGL